MPYDPVDNPLVLFRAQFPFRGMMQTSVTPAGAQNADTSNARFPSSCTSAPAQNRSALWVEHNALGESNLEPLCTDTTDPNISGSHNHCHSARRRDGRFAGFSRERCARF